MQWQPLYFLKKLVRITINIHVYICVNTHTHTHTDFHLSQERIATTSLTDLYIQTQLKFRFCARKLKLS